MEFDCPNCKRILSIGEWPWPCKGDGDHTPHGGNRITAYHASEQTVVYRNPATGQVAYPARADAPMDPRFVAQGYVRETIDTPQKRVEFERETGKLHVQSHYDSGSGTLDKVLDPPPPPKVEMNKDLRRALISDINASVVTKD